MRRLVTATVLVVGTAWRVDRRGLMLSSFESIGNLLDMLQPLFLALAVNGLVEGSASLTVGGAIGMALSIGLNMALQVVGINARLTLIEKVGHALDADIAEAAASLPSIEVLEGTELHDDVQILKDQQGTLGGAFSSVIGTFNALVMPVGTILVAAAVAPRLLILLLFSLPALLTVSRTQRWDAEAEAAAADAGRLSNHLLEQVTSLPAGSESRALGSRNRLREHLVDATDSWRSPIAAAQFRAAAIDIAATFVYFTMAAVIIGWLVRDALAGEVAAGTVAMSLLVAQRLQETTSTIRWALRGLSITVRSVGRYQRIMAQAAAEQLRLAQRGLVAPPPQLRRGITLDGLRYRYPGGERDALEGIDLEIPEGSIVAIVGDNGAGKTTLVKLLTKAYEPTEGRILVDDVDLADVDPILWRHRSSGAFQEHLNFEFILRHSVGVGDVDRLDDTDRVLAALDRSGSSDLAGALPEGADTMLGSNWDNGVELSGGQWQRVAVSRAMLRTDPLLLVLDEPSSALDAATQHRLFQRYASTRRPGGTTILVTHRFSITAMADLIVVLDGGRITEVGSHDALMAGQGRYHKLFSLQAEQYRLT